MEDKSKAFQLIKFVWDNDKSQSWVRINSIMQDVVTLAIKARMKFDKSDFGTIFNSFRGGYWFGVNANGKGMGERFYSLACEIGNVSACQSYESFYDFKPFLDIKGCRLYRGAEYKGMGRYYYVTGFDFSTKRVYLVGADDRQGNGKKTFRNFDNNEWREFMPNLEKL